LVGIYGTFSTITPFHIMLKWLKSVWKFTNKNHAYA